MPQSQSVFRRVSTAISFAILLVLCGITLILRWELRRVAPTRTTPAIVLVSRGATLERVADDLAAAGVIRSALAFEVLARLRHDATRLQGGSHRLPGGLTAAEVLERLVSGSVRIDFVTIPEGLQAREIALLLENAGVGPAADLLALMNDPDFAAELGVPAPRLEGYLFPDTYALGPAPEPDAVLRRMVARFFEIWRAGAATSARRHQLDLHQAVTLASIIEEEAVLDRERRTISAVFHNRLGRGMPLQSDPTVLYGVEARPDRRIRRSDLERATPYNTYVIRGLPPGPIANPGSKALAAAVAPDPAVRALYFVARDDGSHVFSETLAQHNRAVQRWQR